MIIAKAYVRVSTEEQAEEGYSLEAQEQSIQAFAKERGWTLAGIYADEGLSAKDTKRPALQQLLKALAKGEVLVAWKLDRLTRSVLDSETLFKQLDKRGAQFVSIMEPYLSTTGAGGTMVRQITAVFAEFYRAQLGENVRHGMAQVARQGRWTGGPLPYGYDYRDGGLVINLAQAEVVRRIFARYVAGSGIRSVAAELNAQGIRTGKGSLWSSFTISYLIRNPLYAGRVGFGRNGPYSRAGKTVVAEGQHEAIIPVDLWESAQRVLDQRKRLPARQATGDYPLTGIARCGLCGASVSGARYKDRDRKKTVRRMYRCMRRIHSGSCDLPMLNGERLEEAVLDELVPAMDRMVLEAESAAQPSAPADADQARRQLADVTRRLERARAAYLSGVMELSEYSTVIKPLKEEQQALLRLAEGSPGPSPAEELERVRQLARHLKSKWPRLAPEERKALLHSAGLRIIVQPGYQVTLERE